ADDVDAALHAGQRRDEDVGAVDGGEVLEPVRGQFQPAARVGDDVPAGPGCLVGARPDGKAYPVGGHAGEGESLGDVPCPVVGGYGEEDPCPGGVLAAEALQLGI